MFMDPRRKIDPSIGVPALKQDVPEEAPARVLLASRPEVDPV